MKHLWLKRILAGCVLLLLLAIPDKANAGSFIGRPIVIAASTMHEVTPAIVYNTQRNEYLVVWSTDRDKCDGIWGQLVSANGKLLGSPIAISVDCPERRYPDVAYDSTDDLYLVVWEQYDESYGYSIQGRRIDGSGKVLDSADIAIRPPELKVYDTYRPAVAYASPSDLFLVVWAETELALNPITYRIAGARVSDTGTIFNGPFTICEGANRREAPDVAYNFHANRYLVVWQQQADLCDIYGQQVNGKSGLYGSAIQIAWYAYNSTAPAVAAMSTSPTENKFLVVWELAWDVTTRDIVCRIVSEDGTTTPVDPLWISGASNIDEVNPAIASTESNLQYFVTWAHWGSPPLLKGRPVSITGAGGPVVQLSGTVGDYPAVAGGRTGDFLIAWQDQPGTASKNIYGQLFGNRLYLPLMRK